MRIGIDARLYNQTGVGRYIRNIISQLQTVDKSNQYYIYLRKSEFSSLKFNNPNFRKKLLDVGWHSLREQLIPPIKFYRDKIDVMHFPYFNVPVFYQGNYLLTVHDLIIDHFDTGRASTRPWLFYKIKRMGYRLAMRRAIKKAKIIAAISHSTQKEIMDHYKIPQESIKVTYDALDGIFLTKAKNQKSENNFSFQYALYVGNAYPHKNLERLIAVWKAISTKTGVKLVLAGDDKFFYPRLQKYCRGLNLAEEVVFYGQANDEQLINLYSNARCLVTPSLMEGFGLPNLEAVACKCLPVISDIPVFHEIWSDKLDYFDPYSFDDIADKIIKVLNYSPDVYREKIRQARKRISDFSWKQTARDTLRLYQEIYI